MQEAEAARIMGELLEQISITRENLQTLGNADVIKILVKNLDEIEDNIFLNKNGNLCKMNLKLNVTWENQF